MKAAIYARVSTTNQTTENQLIELRAAATRLGVTETIELTDNGISGAKGRADRPAFDELFRKVQRREVDVVIAWSIDRLGRSITDLVSFMNEIQGAGADLYIHQQAINTATPAGRMIFGIFSALGEYERELIRERVKAGLERAKRNGKTLGRPTTAIDDKTRNAVIELRAKKVGKIKIAKQLGIGVAKINKILAAA